ncbi:MAG: hypothetical protein Kow0079_02070 [Vicingaceae bacterium]
MKKSTFVFLWFIAFILFACGKKQVIMEQPIPEPVDSVIVVDKPIKKPKMTDFLKDYLELKYPDRKFDKYLFVSVKHQKMYLIENDSIIKKYTISTSKKGVGNKQHSNKTPIGLHSIKEKIGDDLPKGALFKSRIFTGKIATIYKDPVKSPTDDVTSRILWLTGEEEGINKGKGVDSFKRYIYIHGTSEEGLIGTPESHGCIRMKNDDVIELYDLVNIGTPVLILQY